MNSVPMITRYHGAVLLAATLLGACSVNTTVSLSASTPAQVQHLNVTVQEVWLNTSATADATQAGWAGSALATPQTVDLATLNTGTLATIMSGVKIPAGTYKQLRIVFADSSSSLTTSASSAGLNFNAQVQYQDNLGNSVTLPLELASPASQLIIPVTLVLAPSASQFLSGGSTDSTATATSTTTATSTSTPTSTSSSSAATIVADIPAIRNLVLFSYGDQIGAFLNASGAAYDLAKVGGISGTVDVSSVASTTLTGTQGILVSAEALSSDGSRFTVQKSAALAGSGSFTLYPLPVADTGVTTYDLVIHGPGIRSVIIASVPVTAGSPSAATSVQSSQITLSQASQYAINTAANTIVPAAGAQVGLYQTVPGSVAPHVIEYAMLDPFSGGFATNLELSADAIDYGTYSNGSDIALATSAPEEGLGVYRIGTDAPLRASSSLSTTVSASPGVTLQPIFLPLLGSLSGSGIGSLSGTVNFSPAGRFDNGFLLVSRAGQLVDVVNLGASLAGASSSSVPFALADLPVSASALYDVSVRMWNSRDPLGTLTRAAAPATVDMTQGNVQGLVVSVP